MLKKSKKETIFFIDIIKSEEIKKLLHDSNEKVLAVFGSKCLQEYLEDGKTSNGFAVVSNSRVYIRGSYKVNSGNDYKATTADIALDLEDIIKIDCTKKFFEILTLIILSILLLPLSYAYFNGYGLGIAAIYPALFGYISLFMIPPCIIVLIQVIKRRPTLEILYSRKRIYLETPLSDKSEIEFFQCQLEAARREKFRNKTEKEFLKRQSYTKSKGGLG